MYKFEQKKLHLHLLGDGCIYLIETGKTKTKLLIFEIKFG